jgi:hypothetical protein
MAFLSLPIFAGLGIEKAPGFVRTYQSYRESLATRGTLATLKEIVAG